MPSFEFPLDLPDVRILSSSFNDKKHFIIVVESTLKAATCRSCGKRISAFHGFDEPIRLRHVPMLEQIVFIEIRPKRFRCPDCKGGPTSTQICSWYDPRSGHTKAYERSILRMLVNLTVVDIVQREGLGYHEVLGILDRHLKREVDWKQVESLPILGIDEISLRKGHGQFVTVISTRRDNGAESQVEVLAVLPGRTTDLVVTFLRSIPDRLKSQVKDVCIDMCQTFEAAIKEVLPNARIVADRFHVSKAYRKAVDTLRKAELRRLKSELSDEEYKELKGSLTPFRTNGSGAVNSAPLARLFEHSPSLKRAWELREELTGIFNRIDNKESGKAALGEWRTRVERSGLSCFSGFLKTLAAWWEPITNYFVAGESSGWVEGLNNRLKVLKRRCYGLLNLGRLFQRITLDSTGYERFA